MTGIRCADKNCTGMFLSHTRCTATRTWNRTKNLSALDKERLRSTDNPVRRPAQTIGVMDKWCTEIVLAHVVLYQLSYAHLHP